MFFFNSGNEDAQDIFLQDLPELHKIWKMQLLTLCHLKLVFLFQIASLFELLAGSHLLPYGRHLLLLLVFGHMVNKISSGKASSSNIGLGTCPSTSTEGNSAQKAHVVPVVY